MTTIRQFLNRDLGGNLSTTECEVIEELYSLSKTQSGAIEALSDYDNSMPINEALEMLKSQRVFKIADDYHDLGLGAVENGFYGEISECLKIYLDYDRIGKDLFYESNYGKADNGNIYEILD